LIGSSLSEVSQMQDLQSHTPASLSFIEREGLGLARKMGVKSGEVGGGEVGIGRRSDGEGTAAGEAFAPASGETES
jgi:hypothetical protein